MPKPIKKKPANTGKSISGEQGPEGPLAGTSRTMKYILIGIFLTILIGVPTGYYIYFMPVEVVNIPFREINSYPRSNDAFTQGLFFKDGVLYESTGSPEHNFPNEKPNNSWVRKTNLKTGQVFQQDLDEKYFGEGLTIFNNNVYQLTWKNRVIFKYDLDLNKVGQYEYPGEGWGITHDDEHLIISNGSELLRFLDPVTFEEVRTVAVKKGNRSINNLNELEYVDGKIYANVFQQDIIVEIDPNNGKVTGEINLTNLWPVNQRETNLGAVFNGIAYDPKSGHFFVTGKYCPTIFEIKLIR